MRCQDFERILNEQIDAREQASAERDAILSAHAVECPSCRLIALRYQTLRQVLQHVPVPVPAADFADRFFAEQPAARADVVPLSRLPRRVLAPLAAAAAVLVVALVGWPRPGVRIQPAQPAAPEARVAEPAAVPSLADALASAGSATWSLAIETSAPAARVSREMFSADALDTATAALPLAVSVPPATDVLQAVGDRVSAGVRPLSDSAQHAFGFLFDLPGDAPESSPPSSKGA
jgi:hypothetical protein